MNEDQPERDVDRYEQPNLYEGMEFEDDGDDARAESAFRRAIAAGEHGAETALGMLLTRLGRPAEAAQVLRTGISDDDGYRHLLLGNALQDLGEFEDALLEFHAAANAGESGGLHNAGALLAFQERLGEAIPLWRASHAAGETSADALGSLLADAGLDDEAIEVYQAAADEGDCDALVEIGAIEQDRGRLQKAEAVLREALALGAEEAYVYLASVLQRTDRQGQALALLERGVQLGIASAEVQLANELAAADINNERIEALYRSAVARGDDEATTNLGMHLVEIGRAEEGLEYLRTSAARGDELARKALADAADD